MLNKSPRDLLAFAGGIALIVWRISVCSGTGLGYDIQFEHCIDEPLLDVRGCFGPSFLSHDWWLMWWQTLKGLALVALGISTLSAVFQLGRE